jgi:hypothetical protein
VGIQLTEWMNDLMLHSMKNRISCKRVMALAVVALCSQIAPVLLAQDSTPAPASAEAASPSPASETRAVQLSSGVAEILKLGRAHVGDEVVIAFIRNSGRSYHLSASEILYLRAQGVSDQVVTAMLTAGQNVAATSAQPPPQPAPTQPPADWANSNPQYAPDATQPAPSYDAAAPVYAQPSAGYAYPAPSYGYYGYAPYYWGYPAFSLGFGFGGGYYGGYYRRGYYGYHGGGYYGGYHGGGYPGGGYSHGGGHR